MHAIRIEFGGGEKERDGTVYFGGSGGGVAGDGAGGCVRDGERAGKLAGEGKRRLPLLAPVGIHLLGRPVIGVGVGAAGFEVRLSDARVGTRVEHGDLAAGGLGLKG